MMDLLTRLAAILAGLAASIFLATAGPATAALPPIKHVWIVVLENKNYDDTFGASSQAPYLAQTLPASGELLRQYYGIGHHSLDNYIAMISGQPPTPETQADCGTFSDFVRSGPDSNGVAVGSGCVYPSDVQTIGDQLEGKGLAWKQYAEDMGTACRHPAVGTADPDEGAKPDNQYATKHVPFVYFHSIIDRPICNTNVVDLSALTGDLSSASTTPSFSFITPDLCSDGHDASCADPSQPGGYQGINSFLQTWIPRIVYSPAYADGGLVIVTFDESGSDSTPCCAEPQSPNTATNGGSYAGDGGGRAGAVLLSRYIKAGTVNDTPYNHYSLLRSLEDLFGLPYLGYAGQAGLQAFGDDVFTQPTGFPPAPPTPPKPKVVSVKNVPGAGKCSPKSFVTKIKATSSALRDVRVYVDGKRIALKKKLSFSLSVSTRKLKRGKHKLLVSATDTYGQKASKSLTFKKC
jgi:hypothetical protein